MSEFTLIIGNKNYSSWSLRAWIWMKHLGIEFDEVRVALNQEDTDAKLAHYFSNNKVPLLIHNGLEIWDSLAIGEYLAELYPQHSFPEEVNARATMRALCAEMHSSFTSLRSELPMNCRRTPSPVIYSDDCLADIRRIEQLWEHAAGFKKGNGNYLFGSFSLADAMFAPVVFRLHRYAVRLNDLSSDYVDSMLQHPAMVEWNEAARAEKEVIEGEER